jgi:iron(III) transport system substrate-binding protein
VTVRDLFSTQHYTRRSFATLAGGTALAAAAPAIFTRGGYAQSTPVASDFPEPTGSLVLYAGRSEELVGGLIDGIQDATGVSLDVRYGNTAELAAQILEEGNNTPAGLYFGQDGGALGALAREGRFAVLPAETLEKVEPRFRSPEGTWIGLSGRARVLVYNPDVTDPATLPASIIDLPATELNGPIGWAPTNASFQAFVTALRVTEGEDAARAWLEAIMDTDPVIFSGNGAQVEAVANQEISVGIINHYYLHQARKENPDIAAENYFFPNGDLGSLINVAGVGIIAGSPQAGDALLAAGVQAIEALTPLDEIETPDFDLTNLDDLAGTLTLLTDLGLI